MVLYEMKLSRVVLFWTTVGGVYFGDEGVSGIGEEPPQMIHLGIKSVFSKFSARTEEEMAFLPA